MTPLKVKLTLNWISLGGAIFVVLLGLITTQAEGLLKDGRPGVKLYSQYNAGIAKKALGLDVFGSWGDQVESIEPLSEESVEDVEALLRKWQEVKLGDRVYKYKRVLFLQLADYLHSIKEYERLSIWSGIWRSVDERDVSAMAYYYEALKNLDHSRIEGACGIILAAKRFPRNPLLSKFSKTMEIDETDLDCQSTTQS